MEQVLNRNLEGALAASKAHISSTYQVVLKVLAEDDELS